MYRPGNYLSSESPSISITSDIADSTTCFFEVLPRCDFGFRFFLSFGVAAEMRFAWHAVHVQLGGCLRSVLWWRSLISADFHILNGILVESRVFLTGVALDHPLHV